MMCHCIGVQRSLVLACVLSGGAIGSAASTEAQTPAPSRPAQAAPPSPTPSAKPATDEPAPVRRGQPVNIRIELLLTDSVEGKVIAEERFNTLLADRQLGRVRRQDVMSLGTIKLNNQRFEVDVLPEIVGDRLMLVVTLTYSAPAGPTGTDETAGVTFVENVSAFFDSGKPLTIIEAKGDPVGNRRVVVQATATILK